MDTHKAYKLSLIKQVKYDKVEKCFYVVSNMYKEQLGFYIIRIKEDNLYQGVFLIK